MLTFIINSKSVQGRKAIRQIKEQMDTYNMEYRIYTTKKAGDTITYSSKLTSGGKPRTIILLGGDGTLNEFLNGIHDPSLLTLGYIPIGSGNDFARGMKIKKNIKKELDHIIKKVIEVEQNGSAPLRKLDYGILHCPDGTSKRFFVSCGVGYDAKVCVKVETSRLKPLLNRIGLGKLIYLILGLRYLINAETYSGTLCLDGKEVLSGDSFLFVSWQNQPYEGGGFYFAPKAIADDGYLDVCVAKGIPKWKIPFIIPLAKFGLHTKCKGVHLYRCKEAIIKSDTENYVHTDGETRKNMRELHIELAEAAIPFLQ